MAEQPKKPTPQERTQKRIKNQIEKTQQLAEILTGKRPLPGKFRGKYKKAISFREWLNDVEKGFRGKPSIDKNGVFPGWKIQLRRVGKDGNTPQPGK